MTTKSQHISVSGLPVEVVRKPIKNLHLGVYPPNGRVRVAAPLAMTDDAIRLTVITKLAWIRRHRERFASQERQSPREYVTGETHYYQGRRYRLNIQLQSGRPVVVLRHGTLELQVAQDSSVEQREQLLYGWYRRQLKQQIPELLAKWEQVIGVQTAEWGVKRMKTRWGTCNPKARRIWLNLELVKKPVACLEYIIVHELVHLLERHHNDRFTAFMDQFMPLWRQYREELNRQPLGHEAWGE